MLQVQSVWLSNLDQAKPLSLCFATQASATNRSSSIPSFCEARICQCRSGWRMVNEDSSCDPLWWLEWGAPGIFDLSFQYCQSPSKTQLRGSANRYPQRWELVLEA